MKLLKNIAAAGLALCLCFCVTTVAMATAAPIAETETNQRWQEIISRLCEEYETEPVRITAGYLNLVTGEELYHQGDTYMLAASMFKVPLTMWFAERIGRGGFDWDAAYPSIGFTALVDDAIIRSSNRASTFLIEAGGGFINFRRGSAGYVGVDPDDVDPLYYLGNYMTPRQMICCAETLYSEPERFPGIIEAMLQAEPEHYFRLKEKRFNIAQKYGYVHDDSGVHRYMNTFGIVYTDEPIALTIFTENVPDAENMITDFCTAMCDYTAEQIELHRRKAEEKEEVPDGVGTLVPELTPVPQASPTKFPQTEENHSAESTISVLWLSCLLILGLTAACFAILMIYKYKKKH